MMSSESNNKLNLTTERPLRYPDENELLSWWLWYQLDKQTFESPKDIEAAINEFARQPRSEINNLMHEQFVEFRSMFNLQDHA